MAGDWSTLPVDLLGTIALKSESFEEFFYFSAVCRSWNCASSSIKHQWRPAQQVPWLLLAESKVENPDCVRDIFNPGNNKCYKFQLPGTFGARCWGSAYGWIAMAKCDFTIQLFNPITKAHVTTFPSWETLYLNHPYVKRLLEDPDIDPHLPALHPHRYRFLTKIIVLKVSQRFVVFVLYNEGKYVAFARQGDKSWTSVLIRKPPVYDVVAWEEEEDGRVFAITYYGAIVCWNVNEFGNGDVKPMDYSHRLPKWGLNATKMYLVRPGGTGSDLFMVMRYMKTIGRGSDIPHRAYLFEIRKFNHQDRKWELIEDDFGDITFFVGQNSSMSVCGGGSQLPCLQSRSVYFTDDEVLWWNLHKHKEGGHDMGIFHLKSKAVTKLAYHGDDILSLNCSPT